MPAAHILQSDYTYTQYQRILLIEPMKLTMHSSCKNISRQHAEFDFDVEVNEQEMELVKQLLTVTHEAREDFGLLRFHHRLLYDRIRQKAADLLHDMTGEEIFKSDLLINWGDQLMKDTLSDIEKVADDDCPLLYEEIGGVAITEKNIVGFHYREHYEYDSVPGEAYGAFYMACDTFDCNIYGLDDYQCNRKASKAASNGYYRPECTFLTVDYMEDGHIQTVTVEEHYDWFHSSNSLQYSADSLKRAIRIIRRGKPNADPKNIERIGEPNPKIYKHAKSIIVQAHKGQTDKSGKNYVLHPIRVAERCNSLDAKLVALLHDTIEDTDITPEFLLSEGFSQEIVDAVLSVTKREGETYEDFVRRAAKNPLGKEVKKADLEDNMDIRRLSEITDEDVARLRKYLRAWHYLNDQ